MLAAEQMIHAVNPRAPCMSMHLHKNLCRKMKLKWLRMVCSIKKLPEGFLIKTDLGVCGIDNDLQYHRTKKILILA